MGSGARTASWSFVLRCVSWRLSDLCHARRTWATRKQDTKYGAALIILSADSAAEVSVAADKGGPKMTVLMTPRTVMLLPHIHRDTRVLVTATRTFGTEVCYRDGSKADGVIKIKSRRRTRFGRRKAAQPILIGNPSPVLLSGHWADKARYGSP